MEQDPSHDALLPAPASRAWGGAPLRAARSFKQRLVRLLPFLGPAFVASVAYMDPGNFATNIQAGSKYGYTLLWVVVVSNLMAMLVQTLSAKLGIATGHNLAEVCRQQYPRWVSWALWVLMEIVAMATDLAEFLGAAMGFALLLGRPLWECAVLAAIATMVLLGMERRGFRRMEAVITAMVAVVAGCYLIETILDRPHWSLVLHGAFVPRMSENEMILLAAGILGATVMPHAIFLHSSLMQTRLPVREPSLLKRLLKYERIDILIAMGIAGLVNAAMLIMAASTFFRAGLHEVASIEDAHRTLEPLLGSAASWIFAISLLASGLSSTVVGTMAGQVMMQGFIHRHIPIWVRRLVTLAPSIVVILMGLDPTRSLVISQVVLSFGLPFAIIPLVWFTARKAVMGELANRWYTTVAAGIIAALVVALNLFLLIRLVMGEGS